ncbi:hypothetical protein V2J09_001953 [Rumex salicifolius]
MFSNMKPSSYPVLNNRPIDQWKVTELKEELKRRKLITRGLKEELVRRLDESLRSEMDSLDQEEEENGSGDDSQPKGDVDETTPIANESVNEGPKVDTGADLIVNNEEDRAYGKNVEVHGDSQAKDNADETAPIAKDSVSEAPIVDRDDDIVVMGAEDQADAKNIDVHGDSLPMVNADEMTKVANQYFSEALGLEGGVDLVYKDEENLADGKILEVDNVSGQAVDDFSCKSSDQNLGELTHASPAVKDEAATDEKSVELSVTASEVISSEAALSGHGSENKQSGNKNSDSRTQMDAEDVKPSDDEVNQNMTDLNNQVSEVSPSLGVKNDSNSTDSVSINEMNELKDNIIADDVKLESDVKHELVQPSSSPIVPDGGKSRPMDVEEPQNKVSVDETKISVKDEEMSKKNSSADVGSPEKLNLDRSSCDDSMEEDTLENKQVDSTYISDEAGGSDEKIVVTVAKEDETSVDIMGDDLSAAKKDGHVEDMVGVTTSTEKRKVPDDQEPITNNEPSKRQRRWKTESVKASEPQSLTPALSTTPRGVTQAPGLTRSFSRSNSNAADDDAPKERVVPPPSKPPSDSLRIDNFVRPFTLKAVQEFLGKTGTVTSFWMDHIKTHCFVTYSSVEEATETRNTVYNLQWPPNGGRLLAAEFVDAEEVKSRVDGPPQPPTPVAPTNAPQAAAALLPSPRQLGPRQKQMLQTNLPPPPPLTNPPPVRERLQPPPPPPPLEKVEPPVVTLDDLFRKTKMTPRIYYLPLSEEQVKAKVEAQRRNSKP